MKELFTEIYNRGGWLKGSGWGSWPGNTVPYVSLISDFLNKHNIKSVVDVGCGDWQFSKLIDWTGIDYKGFDIVESVIEEDKEQYQSSNITFECVDVTTHKLPAADLILIKDVLMHWTPDIVIEFLHNLPEHKYVLVTNTHSSLPEHKHNNQIKRVGGFQDINFEKPPYNMKVEKVLDYTFPHPKAYGVVETKRTFLLLPP